MNNLELYCINKYYGLQIGLIPEVLDIILLCRQQLEKEDKKENEFIKYTLDYLFSKIISDIPYKGNINEHFCSMKIFIHSHLSDNSIKLSKIKFMNTASIITDYYLGKSKDMMYGRYLSKLMDSNKIHDKLCNYLYDHRIDIRSPYSHLPDWSVPLMFKICADYYNVSNHELILILEELTK